MAIKAMKPFTGSGLTVAAFTQYHEKIYREIVASTPAVLHLETLAPDYAAKVNLLLKIIRRVSAYSETTDVAAQDKLRDSLLSALFTIFKGYQMVPAGDSAGIALAVQALAPFMSAYNGIQRHELNRETLELTGLLCELGSDAMLPHATKLGLLPLLGMLTTANDAVNQAINTRNADAATRAPLREVSTDEQRRIVTEAYNDIVATVNAFFLTTKEEAIGTFIDKANTVAEYYRTVQANTGKKRAPLPADEPTANPIDQDIAPQDIAPDDTAQ